MFRKIICWFFALVFGIGTLGGVMSIIDPVEPSTVRDTALFTVVFAILTMLMIWLAIKKTRAQKKEEKQQAALDTLQQHIDEVNSFTELPVVQNVQSVILKPGEVCHYQSAAVALITKNQVVGRTGGHSGISVRVAKGVTLHSGGSKGQAIREDVPYTYPGILTITNQRIIMTGEKAFEIPVEKLTAVTPFYSQQGDRGNIFQVGKTSYTVVNTEPYWIPKIISLLNEQRTAGGRNK